MILEMESLKSNISGMLEDYLQKDLFYQRNHAIDVYESAYRYANLERIAIREKRIVLVAALLHDSGFTRRYEDNKEISVEIADSILPNYGFSDKERADVYELIRSTKTPHDPKNLLQKIICDSDMDYLGRLDFFLKSDLLRSEMQIYNKKVYTEKEWNNLQLELLKNHIYFTISAKKIRNKGKIENIRKLKKRI